MAFSNYLLLTLVLGFVPPLFWLWFWLKEDTHPEPKKEIVLVFLGGMGAVIAALILESNFLGLNEFVRRTIGYSEAVFTAITVIGFAFIEEISKTGAALFTVLKTEYFDEPEDGIIYMITAALGFAALENALFISGSLKASFEQSLVVSAFRFINAVLLHISSAAIIGAGFAFSFFHRERRRRELVGAILIATVLHALYNFFILYNEESAISQLGATLLVVVGAITALILFEQAKKMAVRTVDSASP